jgi:chromosome segregation ATPase
MSARTDELIANVRKYVEEHPGEPEPDEFLALTDLHQLAAEIADMEAEIQDRSDDLQTITGELHAEIAQLEARLDEKEDGMTAAYMYGRAELLKKIAELEAENLKLPFNPDWPPDEAIQATVRERDAALEENATLKAQLAELRKYYGDGGTQDTEPNKGLTLPQRSCCRWRAGISSRRLHLLERR